MDRIKAHCVTYDHRGWGESDAPASGYSISDLASDAELIFSELGLRQYVLVVHSMGGKVATYSFRKPKCLAGLVLVAPAPPTPDEARQQQLHAYDNRETVLQAIAFLTARPPAPSIQEQIIQDSLRGSPPAKLAWPSSSAYEDISPEVVKIAVPTLILAGEEDRQDPLAQQRREVLSRIPGARLQVIKRSGHLSPIDEPAQLADAIEGFASSLIHQSHA